MYVLCFILASVRGVTAIARAFIVAAIRLIGLALVIRVHWWYRKITAASHKALCIVVLPMSVLITVGLLMGFVFGVVLSRIAIVLDVLQMGAEHRPRLDFLRSGAPALESISAKNPQSSDANGAPEHQDQVIGGTVLLQDSSPPPSLVDSDTEWLSNDNSKEASETSDDESSIIDAFLNLENGSDSGDSELSHNNASAQSPSQVEFYAQFRPPEHITDDLWNEDIPDDDGYKTPPRRIRTSTPSRPTVPNLPIADRYLSFDYPRSLSTPPIIEE